MEDKSVGKTAGAGAVWVIETAAVNGCHRIVLLGNAAGGVPFFVNIFCRSYFHPGGVGNFQKIAYETGRFNLLQVQG